MDGRYLSHWTSHGSSHAGLTLKLKMDSVWLGLLRATQRSTVGKVWPSRPIKRGCGFSGLVSSVNSAYCLLVAVVQVLVMQVDGNRSVPIRTLYRGAHFGEAALLGSTNRTATCKASPATREYTLLL